MTEEQAKALVEAIDALIKLRVGDAIADIRTREFVSDDLGNWTAIEETKREMSSILVAGRKAQKR